MKPGWQKAAPAAKYFGLSTPTFHKMLKRGFPHVRLESGTILVNLDAGDKYLMERSVENKTQRLNKIADEILQDLQKGKQRTQPKD